MTSLRGEAENERQLFERAQAKLDEAFALLRALETQLRVTEERRQCAHLDVEAIAASLDTAVVDHVAVERVISDSPSIDLGEAAVEAHQPVKAPRASEVRRIEERSQLLAYVESAHAEALQLAARPRPLNSAQRQEIVRRITERVEQVAAQLDIRESGPTPWSHVVAASDDKLSALQPTAMRTSCGESHVDERKMRARAETMIAPSRNPDGTVVTLVRKLAGESSMRRVDLKAETHVGPPPSALVMIPPSAPLDEDRPLVSDAMVDEPGDSVPTLITGNPMLEREKAGASMRRDRTPTEVMERPTRNTRVLGPLTKRAVIVAAVAVAALVIICTAVGVARSSSAPLSVVNVPHIEVAPQPVTPLETAPPPDVVNTRARATRSPTHAIPASTNKATPKCATAKCRASTARLARNTAAVATVTAPVVSKTDPRHIPKAHSP